MLYIVGYGAMAKAILEGLLKEGKEVAIVGRDPKKLGSIAKAYGIKTFELENFDMGGSDVILAVKPYALEDVAKKLQGEARILYSILAGTKIEDLRCIKARHYIRAMPNVAASKQASMTTVTGDVSVKEEALELFSAIGETLWVQSEKELDIATAIAGSGPAFLALVAEAIADGGVLCGLKRESAYHLTAGLFRSYAAIAEEQPASIKDRVMSPAGTTAAGYRALEKNGVRAAFMEAIRKAFEKTK